MRALVRSASILLITVATRCQGIVNFANGAAGVNAPVTMAPDNTPVEGPEWQAELWVQDTNNNWIRASQSVPFLTQAVQGISWEDR